MGALDTLVNLAVDQNRRGNISDLMEGLNNGSIPDNQALIKLADITGDQGDLKNAMMQRSINEAQGLGGDGLPKMAQGPNPDGSAGVQAPQQQQSLPQFEQNLGTAMGNPDTYMQGRTRDVAMKALQNLPAGASPMQAILGAGGAVANATGDTKGLQDLAKFVQEFSKNQSEINKNNAASAKDRSQTVTTPIGGAISPGQKKEDENFAENFNSFNNSGGANNTNIALQKIDGVITALGQDPTTGQPVHPTLNTGKITDRAAFDQSGHASIIGRAIDPDLLTAKSDIDGAVLPLAKPLFGSRITNFDAQNVMSSFGLNPYKTNSENISRLTQLKQQLTNAQSELYKSGDYFTKNGTLSGYGGATAEAQRGDQSPQAPASPDDAYRQSIAAELARRHGGK